MSSAAAPSSTASGNLTVWVDSVRLPDAKAYQAAHPNVKVNIVTFDGDGNGATSLQTKIQLWNKAGSGWPDVIFSEQVNDPVWMAQAPFNFAADMGAALGKDVTSQWPATSLAQCTVNGTLVCIQDNLAPDVLWVNQKLMTQFGYTVPKTWQDWAALGQKVAKDHPGYVIGTSGESFGAWIYFWGNQCPLESKVSGTNVTINPTDVHCTEMASLLDPLIKNGTVPPLSVFTPDFAKKYGGATDKVLMMPGAAWYAQAVFDSTLKIPAGEITAAPPLQWGTDTPGCHRSNRRWPMDHLQALQQPVGRCGLRALLHDAVPARPGWPGRPSRSSGIRTAGHGLACRYGSEQVLRGRPDSGHQGGGEPDLAGLEPRHLPGPACLVQHGGDRACCREVAEFAHARIR